MYLRALALGSVLLTSSATAACAGPAETPVEFAAVQTAPTGPPAEASEAGPIEIEAGPIEIEAGPIEIEAGPIEVEVETTNQDTTTEATPPGFDHTHSLWSKVLKRHVHGDLFDYDALAQDRSDLDAYISQLRSVQRQDLESWTREQRYAYWINAYNAFTILKVVKNLPLDSIRDLNKGFGLTSVFDQSWIKLQQLHPSGKSKKLSLNDIENEILRKGFKDARVHSAINCASISCPPLLAEAFVADRLEQQLDDQMRAFISDRKRNAFGREKGLIKLSSIFKWFSEDFERDAGSVRNYVLRYATDEDAPFVRKADLRFANYDWDLNQAPSSK